MRALMTASLLLMIPLGVVSGVDKGDYLSDEEVDKLREAQSPSERIEVYLAFSQTRLTRIDDFRNRPTNSEYDIPAYLDTQFDQYIRITDALKDWIQDHFDRGNDMRAGLKKFLETGSRQIEQLRHMEQTPDAYAAGYRKSLNDAIDDFTDALDGATKALSAQSKLFGELKREEKASAQQVKEREKEEKKRAKEEQKLRKKEHEKGVPADKDEN
jgi:predicted ribosome quality control (RQC) complex YloA/Tae2 family protein